MWDIDGPMKNIWYNSIFSRDLIAEIVCMLKIFSRTGFYCLELTNITLAAFRKWSTYRKLKNDG